MQTCQISNGELAVTHRILRSLDSALLDDLVNALLGGCSLDQGAIDACFPLGLVTGGGALMPATRAALKQLLPREWVD